jgi:periplasmic iron binding protein
VKKRWAGPLVTILIVGGVALILLTNLNRTPARRASSGTTSSTSTTPASTSPAPAPPPLSASPPSHDPSTLPPFREYPIGDEVLKDHMRIAAVWLPPVAMEMEGMPSMSDGGDVIHLEADIHATEGNPNGFARDEFVPYLKIRYAIAPADGGASVHEGELIPMVARDGLHYGASIAMPSAGAYRLTYHVEPPSAGGLGRHSDPVTGVAPWWEPFEVAFDWDYPGPPR